MAFLSGASKTLKHFFQWATMLATLSSFQFYKEEDEPTKKGEIALEHVVSALKVQTDFLTGFALGFAEQVHEDIRCMIVLFLHPLDTTREFARAIYHFKETYEHVLKSIYEVLAEYPTYLPRQRGRIQAMTLVESVWMFLPLHFSTKFITKRKIVPSKMVHTFSKVKGRFNFETARIRNAIPLQLPVWANALFEQLNPLGLAEWFVSD